jgi:hypothetical protein
MHEGSTTIGLTIRQVKGTVQRELINKRTFRLISIFDCNCSISLSCFRAQGIAAFAMIPDNRVFPTITLRELVKAPASQRRSSVNGQTENTREGKEGTRAADDPGCTCKPEKARTPSFGANGLARVSNITAFSKGTRTLPK